MVICIFTDEEVKSIDWALDFTNDKLQNDETFEIWRMFREKAGLDTSGFVE